jgi:uncharacterized protein (DUF2141 family)
MIRLISIYFLLLISAYFLNSCANIHKPTGGAKDTISPKVNMDKSFPKPNTLNYNDKVVELNFDEDIILNNLNEQLLITPLEDNPYKIIPRRNRLRLEFEKPFTPNTTYTFNFRESVKDITEGNTAKNLILSFSTGPYIDSIFIDGNVTDLKNNKAEENILISLYKNGDTLTPKNSKPLYFAKTIKDGSYTIRNIKNGQYDIYAIDDKSGNLKYEELERIAYNKKVNLDSSRSNVNFHLTYFDTNPPYIRSNKSSEDIYEVQFNEGIQKETVQGENKNDLIYNTSPDGKSLYIYNIFNSTDSIPVKLQVSDSTGNVFEKEIKIKFSESKEKKEFVPFTLSYSPTDRILTPNRIKINITSNRPLTKYELKNLIIIEDTIKHTISPDNFTWITKTNLEINKNSNAKDSLVLIVPEKTFSFRDKNNTADTIKFTFKKDADVAVLSGRIQTTKANYIVELLDENYKVIDKVINKTLFRFDYLTPGSYYLRAIEDSNKNEKWDTGNVNKDIQPERIYFYKDKIQLRANWEVQDIVFSF